jgi:hypothetical protein
MFSLVPTFASVMAFLACNVANIFYAAILVSGLHGIKRGRWVFFYISVAVAAVIKPPFLAFLMLPILACAEWISTVAVIGTVAGVFALQKAIAPVLFRGFLDSLRSELVAHHDLGKGLLAMFHGDPEILVPHFVLVGCLAAYMWHTRDRRNTAVWMSGALVLCVFANPRPIGYDLAVAGIPAFYILTNAFRKSMTLASCCMAALLLIFSRSVDTGMLAFMVGALTVLFITEGGTESGSKVGSRTLQGPSRLQ